MPREKPREKDKGRHVKTVNQIKGQVDAPCPETEQRQKKVPEHHKKNQSSFHRVNFSGSHRHLFSPLCESYICLNLSIVP